MDSSFSARHGINVSLSNYAPTDTIENIITSTSSLLMTIGTNQKPATPDDLYAERKLAIQVFKHVVPIIILLGTVGNFLSFAVLLRRSMRSTPMYFYLTLLAVSDTLVLYTSAFKTWIRILTGKEALHFSNFVCTLFMYLMLNSLYLSSWFIVLVTLDRFLVVWFPFRGYLLTRIRHARIIAVILVIIVAIYNIHAFWTFRLYESNNSFQCRTAIDSYFMNNVFEGLKLVSYCAVPFTIVTALNIGIVIKINQTFSSTNAVKRAGGVYQSPNKFPPVSAHGTGVPAPGTAVGQAAAALAASSGASSSSSGPSNAGCYELESCNVGCRPQQHKQQQAIFHNNHSHNRVHYDHNPHVEIHVTTSLSAVRSQSSSSPAAQGALAAASSGNSSIQRKRQRRMTRMLLFISFAWLILTAPFTIVSFVTLAETQPQSANVIAHNRSTAGLPCHNWSLSNETCDEFAVHRSPSTSDYDIAVTTWSSIATSSSTATIRADSTQGPGALTTAWQHMNHVTSLSSVTADKIRSESRLFLVKTLCFILVYLNHASNFYLYCVTGRKFRMELVVMVTSGWRSCLGAARTLRGYTGLSVETITQKPFMVTSVRKERAPNVDVKCLAVENDSCGTELKQSSSGSNSSRARTVMNLTSSKRNTKRDENDLYS